MSEVPHISDPRFVSEPPRLGPAAAASATARPLIAHSGMTIDRFFRLHVIGAILPMGAGLILYGWRATVVMVLVLGGALAAWAVWHRIGQRGRQLRRCHILWQAALLSMMLPAHFGATAPLSPEIIPHLWAGALVAGIMLVMLTWLLGPAGSGPSHPVILTYLLLATLLGSSMIPQWVLQRNHLVTGELSNAAELTQVPLEGWMNMTPLAGYDALKIEPPTQRLTAFTSQGQTRDGVSSLDALIQEEMPPLEDLLVGGRPGPIGISCVGAVIIGGLFLVYRGVIDARIPLLISLAALAALIVLPIRSVGPEHNIEWHWLAVRTTSLTVPTAVTFAAYEILAGPLLFMAFFLATSPALRPMTRPTRCLYALILGVAVAAFQLYVSAAYGAYLALLLVSLGTPLLDRMSMCRGLVK